MNVLVCGSRDWTDHRAIATRLAQLPDRSRIIHGGARGVDSFAGSAAVALDLPTSVFYADWERDGRGAGPIRNRRMLTDGRPDLVIAFWDGKSRGTKDMIEIAKKAGVAVEIIAPMDTSREDTKGGSHE